MRIHPFLSALILAASCLVLLQGIDSLALDPVAVNGRTAVEAARLRRELALRRPALVLLGDSMVGEGVDAAELSRQTGTSAVAVQEGGAASAWCYLALKNLILDRDRPPRLVAIFFRDHYLTEPRFRVDGEYRALVASIALADEPVLERLAYASEDPTRALLERSIPGYKQRDALRAAQHALLMDTVGRLLFGLAPGEAEASLGRVFADGSLDPRLLTRRQLAAESGVPANGFDFRRDVERSFLPEMLRLAEEREIRLVFVRVKRRRDLEPGQEPPGLPRYVQELSAWLEERDVPLVDFTRDPRIRLEHYAAGDHLSRGDGRRVFTGMLAEVLAPELAIAGQK